MGKMGESGLLGVVEILKKSPCGYQPGRKILNPHALKRIDMKMLQKALAASVLIIKMRLQRIDRDMEPSL